MSYASLSTLILFFFFLCDESEKCIYAQERTSVRGKTDSVGLAVGPNLRPT